MKRNKFIKASLLAMAVVSTPFTLLARSVRKFRDKKGFKVEAGKDRNGKSINLFDGDTFDCKVSSTDSDGDIYVFESIRVKEGGPSHHYHFEQDEWWYILKGEFIFKIGETIHKAKAGDTIFGPRMVPHSFAKVGEGEARLLMFFQPAGKMEVFFNKMSQGIAKNMTEAEQEQLRIDHGFKKVGPPIGNLKF